MAIAAIANAQALPFSVSYQGAEAFPLLFNRRAPRALGLVKTITCNPGTTLVHVPTALVDQRIEASGMPVLARAIVIGYIRQTEDKDWKRTAVKIVKYAAFAATLAVAQSKGANDTWRVAAPAASVGLQQLSQLLAGNLPPSAVESLGPDLLVREMVIEPGGCGELLRVVRASKNYPPIVQGEISVTGGRLAPIAPQDNLTCVGAQPCADTIVRGKD